MHKCSCSQKLNIAECRRWLETNCVTTRDRKKIFHPRVALHQSHAHGHAQKMFCRRHVHPLSEKNNVQSGSCRMRTRALLIWRGLEGVTLVSMEFETVAMATPCFLAKGCSWGSLPFLFYPSSNANRKSMCVLARIFSWPWFIDEKAIGNYSCNPCTIIEGTYKFYIKKKITCQKETYPIERKYDATLYYIKYITFSFSQLCDLF